MCRTEIPEVGSVPTMVASMRSPSCSSTLTDRAERTAGEVVAIMPPASTTRPVPSTVPVAVSMSRATVDGRTAATIEAMTAVGASCLRPGSVVGTVRAASLGSGPEPPPPELVVATTRPAATRATTTQAVAPPTSHGPVRSRGGRTGPVGSGATLPSGVERSEGWRHRRSSGGIQPRIPPPSRSSGQSSPDSCSDAPRSSPSTSARLVTTDPVGASRPAEPVPRSAPVDPSTPTGDDLALR
jgi:hypothetical protein